ALREGQAAVRADRDGQALDAFRIAIDDLALPASLRLIAVREAASLLAESNPGEALSLLATVGDGVPAGASDIAAARWQAARTLREHGDPAWVEHALGVIGASPASGSAARALDALEDAQVGVPTQTAALVRYRARDNERAAELYRSVLEASPSPEVAAEAWFYLGALDERAGEDDDAIVSYGTSLDHAPQGWLAADAHWWRGQLLARDGRYVEAVEHFDAVVTGFPQSRFATPARLEAALSASRSGDLVGAATRMRAIVESGTRADGAMAAYWLGQMGQRTAEEPTPAEIDPFALGALLEEAGAQLALPPDAQAEWAPGPGDWDAAEAWMAARFGTPPEADPAVLADPTLGRALAYLAVEEFSATKSLFTSLGARVRGEPHETLALARLASEVGLPTVALSQSASLLGGLTPAERLQAPRAIERLAFPAPFADGVTAAAEAEGVPPLLLLALVRQESAFDHHARSGVGALGLTQVMPATGEGIAQALEVEWSPESLSDPPTALRYGAYYLASMIDYFDGDVLAAVAAYNAGPGSSTRWLRDAASPHPHDFIHAIDFEETRLYVERVFENYAHYRYVYDAAPGPTLR
ncbi:MAG: transglycosylase SLT domain-containing protein, partial [Dehalococcoidia bacterium]